MSREVRAFEWSLRYHKPETAYDSDKDSQADMNQVEFDQQYAIDLANRQDALYAEEQQQDQTFSQQFCQEDDAARREIDRQTADALLASSLSEEPNQTNELCKNHKPGQLSGKLQPSKLQTSLLLTSLTSLTEASLQASLMKTG